MPIEDIFSISGRGTVVTGRVERGKVKVGEEIEIVGIRPTVKKVVTGVEMFKKLLDEGVAGDNVGLLLTRDGEGRRGAGAGDCEDGVDHAAHEVQGGDLYIDEGRGGTAHAVFQGVPAAVLLSDDGRDGSGEACGGDGDGDAGGQCGVGDRADLRRLRWRRGYGLRSEKGAARWAPEPSPTSWPSGYLILKS